jgi:branched-chain amino acid aminotransferase
VTPIRSVDDRVIGEPGPVTRQIQAAYADVVRGRNAKYDHWVDRV